MADGGSNIYVKLAGGRSGRWYLNHVSKGGLIGGVRYKINLVYVLIRGVRY